jgi:hypothetical protein
MRIGEDDRFLGYRLAAFDHGMPHARWVSLLRLIAEIVDRARAQREELPQAGDDTPRSWQEKAVLQTLDELGRPQGENLRARAEALRAKLSRPDYRDAVVLALLTMQATLEKYAPLAPLQEEPPPSPAEHIELWEAIWR